MNAKHILVVDTSSRVLSVAIKSNESVFEASLDGSPRHSEQLISLIEQGLKSLKLKKNDLEAFVWGLGPGSFTGLRIGVSVLKGFHIGFSAIKSRGGSASGGRKKTYGVSSLDLIALGSGIVTGELAVCVDARREHIYTAIYRFKDGRPQKKLQDSILSFDQFIKKIGKETVLTGDALKTYGSAIRKKMRENLLFLPETFWYPRGSHILSVLSEPKWLAPLSLKTMAPRYFRVSEAEERLKSK